MLLRNFLYLDDRLATEYLAQIEVGVYEEESLQTVHGRSGGVGAGVRAGMLDAKAERGGSSQSTTSRTVQQTPESRYARLEEILQAEDSLQWLEAFDDQIWTSLKRGEALQIEATVQVPDVFRAMDMAKSAGPVIELMEAVGEVDDEAREAIDGFRQLDAVVKKVTVVAKASGAPRFKFIVPLDPAHLRAGLDELTGECQVVGTLARRLRSTEKYSLLDSMGMGGLPRSERRKAERDMRKGMPDAVISSPAAILTPIAIYR